MSYETPIKWQPCLQQGMQLKSVLNFISTLMLNTLTFFFYLSLLFQTELKCHNSWKLCKIQQNYINL